MFLSQLYMMAKAEIELSEYQTSVLPHCVHPPDETGNVLELILVSGSSNAVFICCLGVYLRYKGSSCFLCAVMYDVFQIMRFTISSDPLEIPTEFLSIAVYILIVAEVGRSPTRSSDIAV